MDGNGPQAQKTFMRTPSALCSFLVAALAAGAASCAQEPLQASTDQRKQAEARVHQAIVGGMSGYRNSTQPRALAGCINWQNSSLSRVDVKHLFWYYESLGSDIPVFTSKLMNSALRECDRLREKRGHSDCSCVRIDVNGQSVLEIPSSFLERQPTAE